MHVSKLCVGMPVASFHTVVSGAASSFLAKYGLRADKTNLCKFSVASLVCTAISAVFGISRDNRLVICAARGCSGSVVFEKSYDSSKFRIRSFRAL